MTMVPDIEFSLWLDTASRNGDTAALAAGARHLESVIASAFGSAHTAHTATQRLRRVEQALAVARGRNSVGDEPRASYLK